MFKNIFISCIVLLSLVACSDGGNNSMSPGLFNSSIDSDKLIKFVKRSNFTNGHCKGLNIENTLNKILDKRDIDWSMSKSKSFGIYRIYVTGRPLNYYWKPGFITYQFDYNPKTENLSLEYRDIDGGANFTVASSTKALLDLNTKKICGS